MIGEHLVFFFFFIYIYKKCNIIIYIHTYHYNLDKNMYTLLSIVIQRVDGDKKSPAVMRKNNIRVYSVEERRDSTNTRTEYL